MTVRELIAKLQEMPQDAMVCALDQHGSWPVIGVASASELGEDVVDLALSDNLYHHEVT